MPTPPTTNFLEGLPWAVIIPIVLVLLGALGVTLKLLFKGTHKRINGVESTLGSRIDKALEDDHELADQFNKELKEKFDWANRLLSQLETRLGGYFSAHDRLRDKWEEFLKDYLKIDISRGQKVDALFRLNDQMQKILDTLPRHVDSKIEEAFTHSLSELKLYIIELLAKESH